MFHVNQLVTYKNPINSVQEKAVFNVISFPTNKSEVYCEVVHFADSVITGWCFNFKITQLKPCVTHTFKEL